MPTIFPKFLELPLEIRQKIYDHAIPQTTIALNIEYDFHLDEDDDRRQLELRTEDIKETILAHRESISLFYVSKEAFHYARDRLYGRTRVIWMTDPSNYGSRGTDDVFVIDSMLKVKGMRKLMEKAGLSCLFMDLSWVWRSAKYMKELNVGGWTPRFYVTMEELEKILDSEDGGL